MTPRLTRRSLAASAALLPAALIAPARAADAPDSTFERVRQTRVLRIAALPGEAPYFFKDIVSGTWSGAAIEMAKSIAAVWDAKLDYVESTYGNSVLDLQSGKVDLAFALNPTPARALAIGFTHPMIVHPYGCLARHDLAPKTWGDINQPDLRVAFDIGSLHDTCAHRFTPRAQLLGFPNRDAATLALQSGRADVLIQAAMLGLASIGRNPALGPYHLLTGPLVALPTDLGVRREADTRFVDVINAWLDYNRGIGQIREWMLEGLAKLGVQPDQVAPEITF